MAMDYQKVRTLSRTKRSGKAFGDDRERKLAILPV